MVVVFATYLFVLFLYWTSYKSKVIEADEETLPYAEEDWQDPEQKEVTKNLKPDIPFTMQTRQSDRKDSRRSIILTEMTS